ncbi:PD-(D/E)XK nuclease domain-containing protein [Psychroserpens ponticola]|uniref:PD-(D/E)XK nuclease domain-containing protein n=1 Tax=Psychroserpens ponticola TaxID=2932268 RepID=A0ABY7S2A1_9FLAO|nr:PD-(D/E)XK nuclease domain-containing protein [Psychroserpens ponticola]WCO03536.1 PD-(D/E)XK nuclease domain-containing protein [Psychroserpens ponticola]
MKDRELIKLYEESYKVQYDDLFESLDKIYINAVDKQYATKFQLGIINLVGGLMVNSELDKKIIDLFDHSMKLGGNIIDVINAIPQTANFHKQEEELKTKNTENEVTIVWKKILGIPYKIERINAVIQGTISSNFENLTEKSEIAEYLGKQRAIVDLRNQIKVKFIENGGLKELDEKNGEDILPVKFQTLNNLKECLIKNDLAEFFKILQGVFASLSYDMKITEGYFHSHIHFLLTLLDFDIHSEVETNKGRIDSVIETKNYIHIIEFKQNDSEIALEQILEKEYYQKYFSKNKILILVGVAVDKKQRNIIDWKMKSHA